MKALKIVNFLQQLNFGSFGLGQGTGKISLKFDVSDPSCSTVRKVTDYTYHSKKSKDLVYKADCKKKKKTVEFLALCRHMLSPVII